MNADDMMEFLWEVRNNFGKQADFLAGTYIKEGDNPSVGMMAAVDTILQLGELELLLSKRK